MQQRRHADVITEIVDQARNDDPAAWNELVREYHRYLLWIVRQYRLTADDAADVIQETWLLCWSHLDQLSEGRKFTSWLTTICRRESLRAATRRQREVLVGDFERYEEAYLVSDAESPGAQFDRQEECTRLKHAIAELPQRQRDVLVELMNHDGNSYRDMAQRLGMPVGSLGPTRQRAVERLRRSYA